MELIKVHRRLTSLQICLGPPRGSSSFMSRVSFCVQSGVHALNFPVFGLPLMAGENCNRGAALGALLGAAGSYKDAFIPQEWKDELRDAQEILPDVLKEMQ